MASPAAQNWAKSVLEKGATTLMREFDDHIDWHAVPQEHTSSANNQDKCRYYDIPCFDANRVVLQDWKCDFYHANRVVSRDDASLNFIAAQAPLVNTAADFWHLVSQERCPAVVQLCACHDGCVPYWPSEVKKSLSLGDCTVTAIARHPDLLPGVERRTLRLQWKTKKEKKEFVLDHIFVSTWPDFGVPNSVAPIVAVVRWLHSRKKTDGEGPVLVHCLAGIGRTSTLIGVVCGLRAVEKLEAEEAPRPNSKPLMVRVAHDLREQRSYSIQTRKQYLYAHACLLTILVEDGKIDRDDRLKEFPFCA